MTTIAAGAARPVPTTTRVGRVVRLNLVNRRQVLVVPGLVMAAILLINAAVWFIISATTSESDRHAALQGTQFSGGSFYIFVFMLILGLQVVTATFPFALGLSVTRRDFSLGSAVTFILLAAAFSVAFSLLSMAETATGGWFLGGHLFTSIYFGANVGQRLLIVFFGLLFCFFAGAMAGTLFMRWRALGVMLGGATLAVLAVVALAVVSFGGSWPAVGQWFVNAGPLGVASWLLVPTAVAALASFAVLRRATPEADRRRSQTPQRGRSRHGCDPASACLRGQLLGRSQTVVSPGRVPSEPSGPLATSTSPAGSATGPVPKFVTERQPRCRSNDTVSPSEGRNARLSPCCSSWRSPSAVR